MGNYGDGSIGFANAHHDGVGLERLKVKEVLLLFLVEVGVDLSKGAVDPWRGSDYR